MYPVLIKYVSSGRLIDVNEWGVFLLIVLSVMDAMIM
jgi:hypothetical protein